jgi:ABC-2 type transport system permease protein
MMLSGFVFPIASMPVADPGDHHIVPARYFLVALRGIVLKGVGCRRWRRSSARWSIFAVVVLGLASLRLARERG